VNRAAKDKFQGIKLYPSSWEFPVYDERVYPIYEAALQHNLLVILHFGITIGTQANLRFGNPLDIQKPAHDFPDLNFMVAHFGAGFFREVLMLMYQTHNVVMDTSGSNAWMNYLPYDLTITKIFERALKAGAACRVVFGTDSSFFPRGFRYNILEEQYNAVKSLCPQLCFSEDDVNLIFKENILRLTGFEL
jgi:predicted TIM-barrel fold metal-dependent hydrolase